jgi:hypothetical protein
MTKSAFRIPHHVALHIFVYAPPCREVSLNIGAGGDGIPARPEKEYNHAGSLATICVAVVA